VITEPHASKLGRVGIGLFTPRLRRKKCSVLRNNQVNPAYGALRLLTTLVSVLVSVQSAFSGLEQPTAPPRLHWTVESITLGQLAIFCDGRIYLFPPTGFSGRPRNADWAGALVSPPQSGAELARARTGSL